MSRMNFPKYWGYDRCGNCHHMIKNQGSGKCNNCGQTYGERKKRSDGRPTIDDIAEISEEVSDEVEE